jgi:hypothetical protein
MNEVEQNLVCRQIAFVCDLAQDGGIGFIIEIRFMAANIKEARLVHLEIETQIPHRLVI